MKPHTNLPNEITGAYYEEKTDWLTVFFTILAVIVLTFVACDLIFGAENVTNFLAELLTRFG